MVHQKQAPTAGHAVGTCFWFARSEDSNRATAPQRRNQQSAGLLVSPRESPRGMRRSAGPDGGSLTESVGLLFCCYSPGRRVGAPSGTRTAAEATAVCGGNREPKQGQRSQRRRPAQGAPDDAGTATRTVPAVRSGGQKGSCAAMRGYACKVWSLRWPASFFQRSLPVRRRSMRGAVPSRRCGRMSVQPSGAGRGSQGLRQDRQGDHGAVRVLLFVGILWYNYVTRRWLVCP